MGSEVSRIIKVIEDKNLQKFFFHLDHEYIYDLIEDEVGEYSDEAVNKWLSENGLKNFKCVDCVSNTDDFYSIIHFQDEDVYIKITGTYDSYGQYEHEYDDKVKQVFPKQVTVIKYE